MSTRDHDGRPRIGPEFIVLGNGLPILDVMSSGVDLHAWCGHCGEARPVDAGSLYARSNARATVGLLERRLACKTCGRKQAQLVVRAKGRAPPNG